MGASHLFFGGGMLCAGGELFFNESCYESLAFVIISRMLS